MYHLVAEVEGRGMIDGQNNETEESSQREIELVPQCHIEGQHSKSVWRQMEPESSVCEKDRIALQQRLLCILIMNVFGQVAARLQGCISSAS